MKVRAIAMKNFSEAAIRPGLPMAELEDVLVPVYLLHRYQTEAVSQTLGGQDYRYAVRSDGQMVTKMIPADEQRAALTAMLKTLDPQVLTLPGSILDLLPPRPPSMPRTQESFQGYAGPVFDPMAPVMAVADTTLNALLEPTRATRLMESHARDPSLPGLSEVLEATLKATWYAPLLPGLEGQTQMTVNESALEHLMALGGITAASPLARAVVKSELAKLRTFAAEHAKDSGASLETQAFYAAAADTMAAAAVEGPAGFGARWPPTPSSVPAGAPIEPDLTMLPR